jgi:hypothetical protein
MNSSEALEIYKQEIAKSLHTRNLQWKTNMFTWVVLLVTIVFDHGRRFKDVLSPEFMWGAYYLLLISQLYYSWYIQRSVEINNAVCRNIAEQLNKGSENIAVEFSKIASQVKKTDGLSAVVLHSVVTVLLLTILANINN